MKASQFCYWLQGYFELVSVDLDEHDEKYLEMSRKQVECIQKHLALVFKHELDAEHGDEEVQAALNAIHNDPGLTCANTSDINYRC